MLESLAGCGVDLNAASAADFGENMVAVVSSPSASGGKDYSGAREPRKTRIVVKRNRCDSRYGDLDVAKDLKGP